MFSKLNYIFYIWLSFVFSIPWKWTDDHSLHIFFYCPIFKLRCVTTDLLFLLHFLCAFLCFHSLTVSIPFTVQRRTAAFISFVFPSWQKVTMAWNEDNKHRISFSGEAEYQHHFTVIKSCFQIKTATYFRRFWTFTALNSIWMWFAKLNNTSTHIPGIQLTFGNQ